ncbi:uncharacterized protein LOC123517940 isoform X2 [Portunus trituberculatus]|uniref:uncharacterized protein LOC123517940 isoform X2 n=1 Tax=Portunus trituberculatus TaxID=210409 RepID=UPI001E1D034A|nr:uncharacterized protein LOC123517940 isoform X2 [Portunus trituberculatus]
MDEEEWGELDENAMEECMILATQLCTQQQDVPRGQKSPHKATAPHSKHHPETASRRVAGVVSNGSVRDSGVCSTRSSSLHHSFSNNNSSVNQKKDVSNSYMRRFDDFSTSSTSSHPNTSMRKTVSGPARNGSLVVSSRSSANKAKSATNYWSGSDASGASNHALLKKDGEEKTDPNEKILMMQGEISLLRSELKRKETALETERLDHNAAIEVMESKGKEKLAKQAAEADMKLKEKSMAFDKLQGELHFKKREVEELLNRCHQLEQQPKASQVSEVPSKRPRIDKNSSMFGKDADFSISSRFDFSRRPAKVCVGVQTEVSQQKNVKRTRLNVASPAGQVSQTRSIATLLSCSAPAASQCTALSMSTSAAADSSHCTSWALPSEWLGIISQGLRENDKNIERKLIGVAVERLQQTSVAVSENGGDHSRLMQNSDDPVEWYESQVGPAIQVLYNFKSSSEPGTLQAISAHLPPIQVKDVIVNRRIRSRLLETAEDISKFMKHPVERNNESLVSALRECCLSLGNENEAKAYVRAIAAVCSHCQLCVSSGVCLISQLCKKVKKLCVPEVNIVRALLDMTWALVKLSSPPWLNTNCCCSAQLLGIFLWHIYQTLEATHPTDKSNKNRKVAQVMVSCVQLLHYWSTVDQDWWEKVAPFPQYPTLMAALASKATTMKFNKETVELLCDLYEYEDGTFER